MVQRFQNEQEGVGELPGSDRIPPICKLVGIELLRGVHDSLNAGIGYAREVLGRLDESKHSEKIAAAAIKREIGGMLNCRQRISNTLEVNVMADPKLHCPKHGCKLMQRQAPGHEQHIDCGHTVSYCPMCEHEVDHPDKARAVPHK